MSTKILFVDDDPNILAAFKRQLRRLFDLEVAPGGAAGLEAIESQGPFAVVVADMRMPGMDGIEFLSRVKERDSTAVRIMLTGNADLQTAIEAVNEGNIFRFLTKPCPPRTLVNALNAAIEQHRLITVERDLLEKTLSSSVRILIEILSLVNPSAFSRAARVKAIVNQIAAQIGSGNAWEFELAAMLSQIGCVTLPADILRRVEARVPLVGDEQEMFAEHPRIAAALLANIPRLERVARMVEGQLRPYRAYADTTGLAEENEIALGAQILKVALDFDELVTPGMSHEGALGIMRRRSGEYNPEVLAILERALRIGSEKKTREIAAMAIAEIEVGMVAHEDIRARSGSVLVPKGQEITYPVLMRVRNFSKKSGVIEPVRVLV